MCSTLLCSFEGLFGCLGCQTLTTRPRIPGFTELLNTRRVARSSFFVRSENDVVERTCEGLGGLGKSSFFTGPGDSQKMFERLNVFVPCCSSFGVESLLDFQSTGRMASYCFTCLVCAQQHLISPRSGAPYWDMLGGTGQSWHALSI